MPSLFISFALFLLCPVGIDSSLLSPSLLRLCAFSLLFTSFFFGRYSLSLPSPCSFPNFLFFFYITSIRRPVSEPETIVRVPDLSPPDASCQRLLSLCITSERREEQSGAEPVVTNSQPDRRYPRHVQFINNSPQTSYSNLSRSSLYVYYR